jgi:hypothetical protein
MYKPPQGLLPKDEPAICFAQVKAEPVKPGNYVSPSKRGPKQKTFDELFPILGDGTVSLKLNRPGPILEEKKEDEAAKPRTLAERIQQKLEKERKEAEKAIQTTQLYENNEEEDYPFYLPNLAKYQRAVEATRLRKQKEYELSRKIFESDTEEEQEVEEEEEDLDELYPLDDEEEINNNEVYEPNEFDRHN